MGFVSGVFRYLFGRFGSVPVVVPPRKYRIPATDIYAHRIAAADHFSFRIPAHD